MEILGKKFDLVTFEQAIKLKKVGFDEPTFCLYDETGVVGYDVFFKNTERDTWNFAAPEIHEVVRWFRNKGIYLHPNITWTPPPPPKDTVGESGPWFTCFSYIIEKSYDAAVSKILDQTLHKMLVEQENGGY